MKRKRLRVQISLHYMIASILTLLLMGGILYANMSSIILREATDKTEAAVNQSGMYIDLYIDRLHAVSALLAEDPKLVEYLSDNIRESSVRADILTTINTALSSDSFIKSIVIVSQDGQVISNERNLTMSKSTNMMQQKWYQQAIMNNSQPFLASARMQEFTMDKDTWVISISREIKGDNNQNIGVLLIDLDYQVIEDYLANAELGKDGFSFILNENAEVVYHEDPSYFQDPDKQQLLQDIVNDKAGYDKKENTLTYTYSLQNTDWMLVSVSSQDGLLAIRKQMFEIFLWVGISLLVLATASVFIFAKRITDPFQRLEQAMQEIETGLSEVPIDRNGCYEAQSLSRHFNSMLHKIEKLMNEITEKEQHLRTSEINALHSQINPHFLYNTLDTIVWMAEFGDSEKVIELTKALASFFRLSLSGGSELTSVEQEMEHVKQYLFIQKERYGEQLQYNIHFDEKLRNLEIPKLLLQPIVENALYHGIRGLKHRGFIDIEAVSKNNDILLIVKDNGEGFDTAVLNEPSASRMTRLGGVGIQNVDERVKLYYGSDYGVTVESNETGGTNVTIRLGQFVN